MAFQAPRIIGGGQIITPQAQGDPFENIRKEVNLKRDRDLKEKALKLEALNIYGDKDYDLERGDSSKFEDFYGRLSGPQEPSFLDLAKEKIGGAGKLAYGAGKKLWDTDWSKFKIPQLNPNYDTNKPKGGSSPVGDLVTAYNNVQSNPNDKESIKELQRKLFPNNPEEIDGIMGKKT